MQMYHKKYDLLTLKSSNRPTKFVAKSNVFAPDYELFCINLTVWAEYFSVYMMSQMD